MQSAVLLNADSVKHDIHQDLDLETAVRTVRQRIRQAALGSQNTFRSTSHLQTHTHPWCSRDRFVGVSRKYHIDNRLADACRSYEPASTSHHCPRKQLHDHATDTNA